MGYSFLTPDIERPESTHLKKRVTVKPTKEIKWNSNNNKKYINTKKYKKKSRTKTDVTKGWEITR